MKFLSSTNGTSICSPQAIAWSQWARKTYGPGSITVTSSDPWNSWVSSASTSTSATWHQWTISNSTITSAGTSANIWPTWIRGPEHRTIINGRIQVRTEAERMQDQLLRERNQRLYEEQRAREAKESAEWQARQVAEARARKAAEERSKKLLVECLNAQQRETLEKHAYFDVKLADGQTYRIHRGSHGNIYRIGPNGVQMENYCVPIDESKVVSVSDEAKEAELCLRRVPDYDHMLAQKLAIEYNLDYLLSKANYNTQMRREAGLHVPARA